MAMPNLRINSKSVITLAAIAALFFVVDTVTYIKASGALQTAKAELEAQENQVENSRKLADKLQATEQKYREVEGRLTTLEWSVSKASYIPTLLKQLENTGKSVNLRVYAVRPSKEVEAPAVARASADAPEGGNTPAVAAQPQKPKGYDTMKIQIEVEGSYWNTMKFLQRLTAFPKIIAVDSIQVSPNSTSTWAKVSPRLAVQLNVRAFVFPEDQALKGEGRTLGVTVKPAGQAVKVSAKDWRAKHESG